MSDLSSARVTQGPSVGDVALGLRTLWVPVVVFVLVVAAAGYAVGTTRDIAHEASAVLVVNDARAQVGVFGAQLPGTAAGRDELAVFARSDGVRLRVAETLDRPLDAVPEVEVGADDEDPAFLQLTVTADRATEAIDLANAYADALVVERRARVRSELDDMSETLATSVAEREAALGDLLAQQAELAPDIDEEAAPADPAMLAIDAEVQAADAALDRLRARLVELEVEAAAAPAGVRVVDPAITARSAAGPEPWHLAVLGGLVAAVVATGVVYLRLSYLVASADGRSRLTPRLLAVDQDDDPPTRRGTGS